MYTPAHIIEWLNADERTRHNRFRPSVLRQRNANRLGIQPQNTGEAIDYKAHSAFLHVSPLHNPLGDKGFSAHQDPITADSWFQEVFEHARRLVFTAHELLKSFGISTSPDPPSDLPEFRQAWEQTQEMQYIFRALMMAASGNSETSTE